MTYQDLVKKVSKALTAVDASGVSEHIAVQVNVIGEAEGAFYVEAADGKLAVEPYDYVDRDALLTATAEDLLAVAAGKLSLEAGIAEGKLAMEGNYDKLMVLGTVFAQLPVKKTRKPVAKKTTAAKKITTAKKTAAPKKAAAKKTAAKAEAAETFVAPIDGATEEAPAKRKSTRTKKAATAAAEAKPAAKRTRKTTKKAEEKTEA